jgi:hypothetical protein
LWKPLPALAWPNDFVVRLVDALNRDAPRGIALGLLGSAHCLGPRRPMPEVGRWGDGRHSAHRLAPTLHLMVGQGVDHHLAPWSTPAWAQFARALRRISLARVSSRCSGSNSFNRAAQSSSTPYAVRHLVPLGVRSDARSRRCTPSVGAMACIAADCAGCSGLCSRTIQTARSRTSGEFLAYRPTRRILSPNGPSDSPGTIQCTKGPTAFLGHNQLAQTPRRVL